MVVFWQLYFRPTLLYFSCRHFCCVVVSFAVTVLVVVIAASEADDREYLGITGWQAAEVFLVCRQF